MCHKRKEHGYILVGVLILLALAAIIINTSLNVSASSAKTALGTKVRSTQYYEAESSIGHVLSWLRKNSQQIITPFRREEFYYRFDRTSFSVGENDTGVFTVPTAVKLIGTNNSAILTNDPDFVEAAFPVTTDITTGSTFDIISEFGSSDLGEVKIRLTLVDVIADTKALDFGPPPNPEPETDFFPVYRIDAMVGENYGSHVYGTLIGDVIHLFDLGIYGQDYLEIRQPCDSYVSADGNYSSTTKRANCPAGSNSTAAVHKNEEIYGSLFTNGTIEAESPYGGDTCADFVSGCPNKGETCAGEDCGVPLLENFHAWNIYCPSEKVAVTYAASATLSIVDSNPGDTTILPIDRCWDKVTINNNVTLTLDSVDSPYYIQTLELKNNSNSRINIAPSDPNKKVELWVENIVGDAINGNQAFNAGGKPTQFYMYYLGTNALTLNGTADMNVALVAPNASVTVSGSFEYKGALLAKQLTLTGSGGIHYDESLGGNGMANNMKYRIRELAQYYR